MMDSDRVELARNQSVKQLHGNYRGLDGKIKNIGFIYTLIFQWFK
jgi:hypothetical protein